MLRILKAFAWMRWRVLVNSLERSGARDTVERFSLAIEQIGPLIAAILMVPSMLVLSGAAAFVGWALARGSSLPVPFEAVRFILLPAMLLTLVGPILLPAAERTSAVRLLLLPIPRRVLYVAQASSTLADPWILLIVPIAIFLPLGMLAGAAVTGAVLAMIAGLLLLAILVGLSSAVTSSVHLAVRDRRRGEMLALIFILVVPMLGLLPNLLRPERRRTRTPQTVEGTTRERPAWVVTSERLARATLPSETYIAATRSAARGAVREAAVPMAALALTAAALHGIGLWLFGRVLASPGSTNVRRSAGASAFWRRQLPGLSRAASAVALAQVRLALRTPRGRAVMLSPLIVTLMFGALIMRSGANADLGFFALRSGISLATFAAAVALVSILPIAVNQFAIDKAGLTLALLLPLKDRDLLAGKAYGNGLIIAMPAIVCVLLVAIVFPGDSIWLWLCLPPGLLAAYLLAAPAAAVLSAIFPRAVDLNSIGRGSNPHGMANTLGLVLFAASTAPPVLIVLATRAFLGRPQLAPLFLLGWCVACAVISRLLFMPALAVFAKRKENLGLIV